MYKFRSMVQNAPLETTEAMNAYVTPIGRLIRRLSLDELPNNECGHGIDVFGWAPALLPSQSDLIEMRKQPD